MCIVQFLMKFAKLKKKRRTLSCCDWLELFFFVRFYFNFLDEFRGWCCEGFRTHIIFLLRTAQRQDSSGARQTGICQAHNSGMSQFRANPGGATVKQQDVEEAEERNSCSRLWSFWGIVSVCVTDRQEARERKSAGRSRFKSPRRLRGEAHRRREQC